jgi:hypothetical protein
MANTWNSPFILDTVMSNTYRNTVGPVNNLSIFPLRVYWLNPSNIGDTFQFVDPNGVVIFEGRCEVANQSQYFDVANPDKWIDWKLGTLSSGKIELYYKSN